MSAPEFNLDRAVEAMRLEHEDSHGADADATRWRIRDSLESARVARGRLLAALVMCGVLSTGGVSWAYLSGRLEGVWPWLVGVVSGGRASEAQPKQEQPARAARIAVVEPPRTAPAPAPAVAPALAVAPELPAPPRVAVAPARTVKPRPAVKTIAPAAPAVEPVATAPAIATAAPVPVATKAEDPVLAAAPDLYRVAHQLHFHGADPAASLAAWDRYLASASSGRFSVEARYNRAMTLIRLGRYHEAQLALQPFALGQVSPVGYRQREAQQLSQRLARAATSAAK
jgi:hypothetical protein